MRSFISTFCVSAPLFTYLLHIAMTISVTQALNNSFADWYCDVPKALRWIPGLGQTIETRRAVKDNVSSFTLSTVNHRGTEGEVRREVSLSYMDEMTIYRHGRETADGSMEIRAIFKGEEVVHRRLRTKETLDLAGVEINTDKSVNPHGFKHPRHIGSRDGDP